MPANEVSKQDDAKRIAASKVYQVVYCIEIRHPRVKAWFQSWYLLQCPFIGINSLAESHRRVKEGMVQLGAKFQPRLLVKLMGILRVLIARVFSALAELAGWMLGNSSFPMFYLKRVGVYERSTLDC